MIATALPAKSGASWRVESGVSLATMDLGYIYILLYINYSCVVILTTYIIYVLFIYIYIHGNNIYINVYGFLNMRTLILDGPRSH